MSESQKTLKDYCREAKKRLKSGFWQNYQKSLNDELLRAKESGISVSKVKEYYSERVSGEIIKSKSLKDEEFYNKVKKILDEEGEISNALGRLTDKKEYESLNYEEKQRYNLVLSEKYLKAVERYKKEKELGVSVN